MLLLVETRELRSSLNPSQCVRVRSGQVCNRAELVQKGVAKTRRLWNAAWSMGFGHTLLLRAAFAQIRTGLFTMASPRQLHMQPTIDRLFD